MKVLITGAFGNLGLMCVSQALEMGYSVRCFDIDSPKTRKLADKITSQFSNDVEVVFGDIRDQQLINTLVKNVDAIIHNAALLPPMTDTHPELAESINVTACIDLINVAEQQSVPPVLYTLHQ